MSLPLAGFKVCYMGSYKPDYVRNHVMIGALEAAGAQVTCLRATGGWRQRYRHYLRHFPADADAVIVAFGGLMDTPAAWLLSRRKRLPLVLDSFSSPYEARVIDREVIAANSLKSFKLFWVEKLIYKLADAILFTTATHCDVIAAMIGEPRHKFHRIWAGAEPEFYQPQPECAEQSPFRVFFVGTMIPLHGTEFIVQAAHLLRDKEPDIRFTIVGRGQTYDAIRALADRLDTRNIEFVDWMTPAQLAQAMTQSHVCLGMFGDRPKSNISIANKVFMALAAQRCVITGRTPAVEEALVHQDNAWLVPSGDAQALADGITTLKNDPALRRRIAENGYTLFQNRFTYAQIGQDLADIILKIAGRRRHKGGNP